MKTIEFWVLLILAAILTVGNNVKAENVQTVYYDSDWKGVQAKEFAYHELIFSEPLDSNYKRRFLLKYSSGEKEGEGDFVSIDPYDFTKSILGSYCFFYRNGNKLVEYKLDGNKMEFTSYYSNGLIENHQTYTNGLLNGISYHFTEDGKSCFQTMFKDGETVGPYYTYSDNMGNVTKYKIKDGKIFQQTPSQSEKKTTRTGDKTYQYYNTNGITIFACPYYGYDYKFETFGGQGKYIVVDVIVTNDTNTPIDFHANSISASIIKKGKRIAARLINIKEYSQTVNATQSAMLWAKQYSERKAANAAAYSYSTSNTSTYYSGLSTKGTLNSAASAVIGTNGAAIGAAVGASLSKTAYSGSVSTATNTVAYSGAAAYQANLIAEQRIKDYSQQLNEDAIKAVSGYLPSKTIMPGESISGRVLFDYVKADGFEVRIPVNGIIYTF